MIRQLSLGKTRFAQLRALVQLIQSGAVTISGNVSGKIYGRLNCRAGKRMKAINRVFFENDLEAVADGFRPCAVCMPAQYKAWKECS
jgi:methylphosphotriester-DNA--protein-cysteine methyltransferase